MKTSEIIERIATASKREILRYNSLFKNTADNWGVVTCGEATLPATFSPSSTPTVTIDVSGWGFESADDYAAFVVSSGSSSGYLLDLHITSKTTTSFNIVGYKSTTTNAEPVAYVIVAKGFGGGVSGGGSVFEVKFSGSTSSVTCDKTFAEISDAITANKIIVAKRDFYGGFYVVQADGNSIEFQSIRAIDIGKYRCETITITDANTVTATSMDYDDIIPTATMPMSTAAVPEGLVLLYTGETTSEYTHGSFYRRNASGGYDLLNSSQGGGSITVDDDLDATSSNPVKNRTIAGVFESFRQLFMPSTYIPNGQIVLVNDFTAAYQFPTGVFPADCLIIFYYDGAKQEALTVVDRGAQYEGQGQWALVGEGGTEITYMDIIPTANPQEFMFAPADALTTSLDFYYKKQASPVTKLVMDELELELGNNSSF